MPAQSHDIIPGSIGPVYHAFAIIFVQQIFYWTTQIQYIVRYAQVIINLKFYKTNYIPPYQLHNEYEV